MKIGMKEDPLKVEGHEEEKGGAEEGRREEGQVEETGWWTKEVNEENDWVTIVEEDLDT